MGLKKLLKMFRAELTWREPFAFRIRLRGDFPARLLITAGGWLIGTGLLFVLLWLTQANASHATVFGLGLIPGLCTFCGMVMMRSQASGGVDLYEEEIRRSTFSYAFVMMRITDERWEYPAIETCTMVPGEETGHSFAVMILSGDGFEDLIGIPRKTSAKQVAKILHEKGVELRKGSRLPKSATKKMPMAIGAVLSGIGLAVLGVGLWLNSGAGPVNPAPLRKPPAFFRPQQPAQNLPPIPVQPKPGVDVAQIVASAPKQQLTPLVGGEGGFAFKKADITNRPVLGIRYVTGDWAGEKRIRLLFPVFAAATGESPSTVSAKNGYALGAIHVSASDFVDGIIFEFMKLNEDGTLDTADSYKSEPIGTVSDSPPVVVSGNGRPVVGIHGRGAAVMDAVGLVILAK